MTLPIFHRSLRIYFTSPTAELELQPPQGKPARQASSPVAVLLPLGFNPARPGADRCLLGRQRLYLLFLRHVYSAPAQMIWEK